jgi:lysophospholipase L1-like esterase
LPDVPIQYDIRINDLGFRGGPIEVPKPDGVVRIAALGDSVTFGFGVAEDDTYPARLAALLAADAAPRRVEWINAGVPGFSSWQGVRHLQQHVLPTRPDVVIVLFGWNDGWRGQAPDSAWNPGALQTVIQSSRLFAFGRRAAASLLGRLGWQHDDPAGIAPRVPVLDFERNIAEIVARIREAGASPVLLTAPAAFGPHVPPDSYFRQGWTVPREDLEPMHQRYVEAARRVAAATATPLVDCARLVPADSSLFLADGYHPNKAGISIMADAIAASVRQLRLVRDSR